MVRAEHKIYSLKSLEYNKYITFEADLLIVIVNILVVLMMCRGFPDG